MALFPNNSEDSMYFSMDDDELLNRAGNFPFILEDEVWQTAEHYYQANKFVNEDYQTKVRKAVTAADARKLGKAWLRKKRSDWAQVKPIVMTRAVYTMCKTHRELADRLLATGSTPLVENSQFDYYWGCGRDRRGHNHYGKVLMNVREKIRSEQDSPLSE